MKNNKIVCTTLVAALVSGVFASEVESSKFAWEKGEGVSFNEIPIVNKYEVSLSFDSRYMTYGVIDGKDPIFTPVRKRRFSIGRISE